MTNKDDSCSMDITGRLLSYSGKSYMSVHTFFSYKILHITYYITTFLFFLLKKLLYLTEIVIYLVVFPKERISTCLLLTWFKYLYNFFF